MGGYILLSALYISEIFSNFAGKFRNNNIIRYIYTNKLKNDYSF